MNFNFELILFYATLVTGLIAFFDWLYWAPRRKKKGHSLKIPMIIDYSRSFFPVLLLVFLLRSFLFEPFRIPSGSLEPTLLTGDFILVNKYSYGIRLPIIHSKIINYHEPKRGDIMIFRWPPNPSFNFIKRIIGVPGDHISYVDKTLTINGKTVPQTFLEKVTMIGEGGGSQSVIKKEEDLLGIKHQIYIDPEKSSRNFHDIVVPDGMYFMMGDNRDDSADSRYWGFVPQENIVGKAVLVWMSWNNNKYGVRWKRIGHVIP